MRELTLAETSVVAAGMGNGASTHGYTGNGSRVGNSNPSCTNGVVGGAVTGFLGALGASTVLGLVGAILGGIAGGAIAGGCSSGLGGSGRNTYGASIEAE